MPVSAALSRVNKEFSGFWAQEKNKMMMTEKTKELRIIIFPFIETVSYSLR
jgi:hypothetical protein